MKVQPAVVVWQYLDAADDLERTYRAAHNADHLGIEAAVAVAEAVNVVAQEEVVADMVAVAWQDDTAVVVSIGALAAEVRVDNVVPLVWALDKTFHLVASFERLSQ